ncbi:MAG: O-methyltransferase [Bdellovibrionaceae bacterium]|nr:O-methyltransferase [Pseudobdellovibrionaceae bacterium]
MREKTKSAQEQYLEANFGLPDEDLKAIQEEMICQHCEGMALSTPELRILQFLIRLNGARRVLEIGTLFGRSSLALARALPDDGQLVTIERSAVNHGVAQGFFEKSPEASRIRSLLGDAKEVLKTLENEPPFDFILIDADKAGYLDYLLWAEKHLRVGGVIVGDNSFLWGGVWDDPEADVKAATAEKMKEFNRRLADPERYSSMVIPTAEGMTVAQKR